MGDKGELKVHIPHPSSPTHTKQRKTSPANQPRVGWLLNFSRSVKPCSPIILALLFHKNNVILYTLATNFILGIMLDLGSYLSMIIFLHSTVGDMVTAVPYIILVGSHVKVLNAFDFQLAQIKAGEMYKHRCTCMFSANCIQDIVCSFFTHIVRLQQKKEQ